MDYYHLREWRNQQQHKSDHSPSAKIPRLQLLESPHQESSETSALPLFVPEPNSRISNLSAFTDSTTNTSRVSRMIGLFSIAQWQELELQALIFKYMLAGAAIPSELLQPIKKSLFNTSSSPYYFPNHPLQQYQHYQPAMLQSGYWGRTAVDPEPGRCRRTDGKKWRCSRDVVASQKYCERHMHRGRNRSRKPVEIPTRPTPTVTIAAVGGGGGLKPTTTITTHSVAALPITTMASNGGNHFVHNGGGGSSASPSMDLLHLNQRCSETELRNNDNIHSEGRSDGQVLRHFFDDWPKKSQQQQPTNTNGGFSRNPGRTSNTGLSISIEGSGGAGDYHHQASSDFSLKLSTGVVGGDDESERSSREGNRGVEQSQRMNWGMSMGGGPLAEALRSSSTSNSSSPTSVLLPPPHGSGSESSSIVTK